MPICSICGTEWPENYCPACGHTIGKSRNQSMAPQASQTALTADVAGKKANSEKRYPTGEQLAELTFCFRWFVGLFALNLLTWWGGLLLSSDWPGCEIMIWIGLVTVAPLAVYFLYRLSRITKDKNILFIYLLFLLFPPTATIALILLCGRAMSAASALGRQITVFPRRLGAGLAFGIIVLIGFYLLQDQISEFYNHARLTKAGAPTTGMLQMVVRHSVNFVLTGYTFTINYAGRTKDFQVSEDIYRKNTVPDGKFTRHEIALVYLPSNPDAAEVAGMPGFSMGSLFQILGGGIAASYGGRGLYLVMRNRSGSK